MKQEFLKKEILEEETVELLEETSKGLLIYDLEQGIEIFFSNEDLINEEWLKSKIWINKKLQYRYKIQVDDIVRILLNYYTKEELQTLNHIYLVYQLKDFDYIAKHNNEELFDIETFWTEQVGLMWFSKQNVFINMRLIEKFAKDFSLYYEEFLDEFSLYGFYTTLFHELRHLSLDTNIFLSEDKYPIIESDEKFVEKYARKLTNELKLSSFNYQLIPTQANYI